jgi:hypothetical protein
MALGSHVLMLAKGWRGLRLGVAASLCAPVPIWLFYAASSTSDTRDAAFLQAIGIIVLFFNVGFASLGVIFAIGRRAR